MNLEQLIYEAKEGNRVAQKELFDRLSDNFICLCYRYVKNGQDAEERMVDGLFKFFSALPTFKYESDAAVYACISRIMVNECIMQLRKKRILYVVAEPLETDATVNNDLLDKISADEIHALICKLPTGARTIFNLYTVDGFGHHEISKLLGISMSTSKSQLTRAREMLQQSVTILKEDYEKKHSKRQ